MKSLFKKKRKKKNSSEICTLKKYFSEILLIWWVCKTYFCRRKGRCSLVLFWSSVSQCDGFLSSDVNVKLYGSSVLEFEGSWSITQKYNTMIRQRRVALGGQFQANSIHKIPRPKCLWTTKNHQQPCLCYKLRSSSSYYNFFFFSVGKF